MPAVVGILIVRWRLSHIVSLSTLSALGFRSPMEKLFIAYDACRKPPPHDSPLLSQDQSGRQLALFSETMADSQRVQRELRNELALLQQHLQMGGESNAPKGPPRAPSVDPIGPIGRVGA